MRTPSPRQLDALALIADGNFYPDLVKEDDGWHARWRALGEDNPWLDEYVRSAAMTRLSEDAEFDRHETLHDAWMMALKSRSGLVVWDDAECAAFAAELAAWHSCSPEDMAVRASIVFAFSANADGFAISCAVPRGRRALRALGEAAYVCGELRGLKSDGNGLLAVKLSRSEAQNFLAAGARDLAAAGYGTEGVELKAEISAEADISSGEQEAKRSDCEAKLRIRIAGEEVSAEEIRFLLEQNSPLVFFRDRWIEVDRAILREALHALESCQSRRLKRGEAMSFALGVGYAGRIEVESSRLHGWLRGLVNELKSRARGEDSAVVVEGLVGSLRDYQRRAVGWMKFLTDNSFGVLLADEMGLGKTVETIAWALATRPFPLLVVSPLTLLSNWRHELARFAPSLRVYVHQGDERHLASGFHRAVGESDVVITSYSLLVRDYRDISEVAWKGIVLDEAQAVKNPETRAAHAVRALSVPTRVALTGTPVENSASDIWSLEDFLNPGFLGERRRFEERFVRGGMRGGDRAVRKLRHALEPFVLRRLKADSDVASELGEKHEIREYCVLSPGQRREYENALADYRAGDRRQGDVFALITELKQICDGDGKLERLFELLEEIFAAGESALVFTQYATVGERLTQAIAERFSRCVPFLHGGLTAEARERAIAEFNAGGAKAFVLSLRAGGFGLNLTKATHVIHFDRWWNPAVENQATDRVHRIGQTRPVFVHLFITEGTLEERVDAILREKSITADALVESGESFLRELDELELMRVVALDGSAK